MTSSSDYFVICVGVAILATLGLGLDLRDIENALTVADVYLSRQQDSLDLTLFSDIGNGISSLYNNSHTWIQQQASSFYESAK